MMSTVYRSVLGGKLNRMRSSPCFDVDVDLHRAARGVLLRLFSAPLSCSHSTVPHAHRAPHRDTECRRLRGLTPIQGIALSG
jgi:hypothetical protein